MEKWLYVLVALGIVALGIYAFNSYSDRLNDNKQLSNQDYIIAAINQSLYNQQKGTIQREQQFQDQKIEILNNITHKIDQNTKFLEALIKSLNVTLVVENGTEQSGTISSFGLGKPKIIPHE